MCSENQAQTHAHPPVFIWLRLLRSRWKSYFDFFPQLIELEIVVNKQFQVHLLPPKQFPYHERAAAADPRWLTEAQAEHGCWDHRKGSPQPLGSKTYHQNSYDVISQRIAQKRKYTQYEVGTVFTTNTTMFTYLNSHIRSY